MLGSQGPLCLVLSQEGGHPLAEQASDAKAFNDLIDRIFVPRLQTA